MAYAKIGKGRVEAFSDGVLAIILTIMVLELKVPRGDSFEALLTQLPMLLSYVLSFVYIGIYWNNHHHMLHATKSVSGGVLWANLHLLFWLSLVPFGTQWMEQSHFVSLPTQFYGFLLFMAGFAYWILQNMIIAAQGTDSPLKTAIGNDWKGKSSVIITLIAMIVCYWQPPIAIALYSVVAAMWIVPDPLIEKMYHV